MQFVFINLDRAADRRAAFEGGFHAAAPVSTPLLRIAAVTADHAARAAGDCSAAEKGCFFSHRAAWGLADGPLMLFEDDAAISPQLFKVLPQLPADAFDLIFTDVGVGNAQDCLELGQIRERAPPGSLELADLSGRLFFGTTAYFVTAAGRAKLHAFGADLARIDLPVDLFLRNLVWSGKLSAAVCVPHLTTTRWLPSQIEEKPLATVAQGYRDLLFVDRDIQACQQKADALWERSATDAQRYAALFAAHFSALIRGELD